MPHLKFTHRAVEGAADRSCSDMVYPPLKSFGHMRMFSEIKDILAVVEELVQTLENTR